MAMIQGNRGTFADTPFIGYSPEIADGVLRLYLVMSDGGGTNKLLVHEHSLEAPVEHHSLLSGHAREMMLTHLKSGDELLNAHSLIRDLEDISRRLTNRTTSDIERRVLQLPEGTQLTIHSWDIEARENPSITYYRHETYAGWVSLNSGSCDLVVLMQNLGNVNEIMVSSRDRSNSNSPYQKVNLTTEDIRREQVDRARMLHGHYDWDDYADDDEEYDSTW